MNVGENRNLTHWAAVIQKVEESSKQTVEEAVKLLYDNDLEYMRQNMCHWHECIEFEQRRREGRRPGLFGVLYCGCRSCGTLAVLSESCITIEGARKVMNCPACGETTGLTLIGNKNDA